VYVYVCISECNNRTRWTNGLTAVLLLPGWRGNGGSILGYHSSLTSLNNDPSSTLDHNTVHSFV